MQPLDDSAEEVQLAALEAKLTELMEAMPSVPISHPVVAHPVDNDDECYTALRTHSLELPPAELASLSAPIFSDDRKLMLFKKATEGGPRSGPHLLVDRVKPLQLPPRFSLQSIDFVVNPFGPPSHLIPEGERSWIVVFADASLAAGYGGDMCGQEEVTAIEIPQLPMLREFLIHTGRKEVLSTLDRRNRLPYPVLVRNMQQRLRLSPDAYGSRFMRLSVEEVLAKCKELDAQRNLICMAALEGRPGQSYSCDEIEYHLRAAYTGFAAACQISFPRYLTDITIHTGAWGCGAMGGNRTMMVAIQLLACSCIFVPMRLKLVYHDLDATDASTDQIRVGISLANTIVKQGMTPREAIQYLASHAHLVWNESNRQ